jgi:hypothetical protein
LAKKSGLITFKERAIRAMPEIKILKTKDELYSLKQDWSVLHSKNKSNSPFSTWEWVSNYEKILMGANEELSIICIFNGEGKLIAIAPFLIKREKKCGLQYYIIELIGSDERIAADYMDIIIDPEYLKEGKSLLMDYLTRGEDFKWDLIRWTEYLMILGAGTSRDNLRMKVMRSFKEQWVFVHISSSPKHGKTIWAHYPRRAVIMSGKKEETWKRNSKIVFFLLCEMKILWEK